MWGRIHVVTSTGRAGRDLMLHGGPDVDLRCLDAHDIRLGTPSARNTGEGCVVRQSESTIQEGEAMPPRGVRRLLACDCRFAGRACGLDGLRHSDGAPKREALVQGLTLEPVRTS